MLVQSMKKNKKLGLPLLGRGIKGEASWFFMAAVIVLPVIAFTLCNRYENKFEKLPVYGKENHRVQSFSFTNQDKNQTTLEDFNTKIIAADFFFTHCPVVCPKMTKSLKRVQDKFSTDQNVHILSFTVDPERDSAVQLKNYARQFGINTNQWTLLTGDKKELYKLARNSFMIAAADGDGGPGDFIHSEKLILLDAQQRIRGYYDGTNEKQVDKLLNDIKKLRHEN
jgi:protein SCO1